MTAEDANIDVRKLKHKTVRLASPSAALDTVRRKCQRAMVAGMRTSNGNVTNYRATKYKVLGCENDSANDIGVFVPARILDEDGAEKLRQPHVPLVRLQSGVL